MPLPKPRKGEAKSDFVSRCVSSNVVQQDYDKQDQRVAVCETQWSRKNNEGRGAEHYRSLNFKVAAEAELRTAQLNGQEHIIVPVVALVEGVLWSSNSEGPELALASEFGRVPEGWDGRPVLQGHPKNANGDPVSANSPDLWDTIVVGMMFNTQLDNKKLKSEMWINKAKAGEDLVDRFTKGMVEVSTGLFAVSEDATGFYNGEKYSGVWRNVVPDHLAILDEGQPGACSIEDGCGAPRINKGADMKSCLSTQCGPKILGRVLNGIKALIGLKVSELSDISKRDALSAALQKEDTTSYCYIAAVYEATFVYVKFDDASYSSKILERGYSIADGGEIILSKDVTEVRAETDYVPVSVSIQQHQQPTQQGEIMTQQEKDVQAAAEAKAAETATQVKALEALTAKGKEARTYLEGAMKDNAADLEKLKNKTDLEVIEMAGAHKALAAKSAAEETEPAAAPSAEHVKALAYVKERKEALIKGLEGKTDMTAAELQGLEPSILEKMSHTLGLAEPVSYAGASPAALSSVKGLEYTPTLEAFPRKAVGAN